MPSNKVIVIGSSGYTGKATLAALTSRHTRKLQAFFAGVRNPDKFDTMDKVEAVKAGLTWEIKRPSQKH